MSDEVEGTADGRPTDDGRLHFDRRTVIRRTAIAAGSSWVVPVIIDSFINPAAAASSTSPQTLTGSGTKIVKIPAGKTVTYTVIGGGGGGGATNTYNGGAASKLTGSFTTSGYTILTLVGADGGSGGVKASSSVAAGGAGYRAGGNGGIPGSTSHEEGGGGGGGGAAAVYNSNKSILIVAAGGGGAGGGCGYKVGSNYPRHGGGGAPPNTGSGNMVGVDGLDAQNTPYGGKGGGGGKGSPGYAGGSGAAVGSGSNSPQPGTDGASGPGADGDKGGNGGKGGAPLMDPTPERVVVAAAAATRVVAEVPAAAAIKAEGEEGEVPHTRRELAQLPLLLRARIAGTTQMIQGLIRDTRAEGTTVQAAGTEAPAATATSVSHGLEHSAPSVRSAA